MEAKNHPHYPAEKNKLDEVFAFVTNYLEKHAHLEGQQLLGRPGSRWGPATAPKTRDILFDEELKQYQAFRDVQQQPYFGRVDWLQEGSTEPETFYVGDVLLHDVDVFNWKDTIVGQMYFEGSTDREPGKRLLKRALQIDHDSLETISDEYVDVELSDRLYQEAYTDSLLLQLLREPREELRKIVATIQAEQYNIIREPLEQFLVIQGAAGSGKTEIALHRVAYLLYQARVTKKPLERLLVLGPNQLFLGYVANVLPSLGEHHIPQKAFDQWLIEQTGDAINYEQQHASLAFLLDPKVDPNEKIMSYRNAANKGSLRMAALLERYVEILQEQVLDGLESLVCSVFRTSGDIVEVTYSAGDLQRFVNESLRLPYNERRNVVERLVFNDVIEKIYEQLPGSQSERWRQRAEERIREQINDYFRDWHNENPSIAYRRLFRNSRLLHDVGQGIFNKWDLELMALDAPKATIPFRFADLAALHYFKILLDGTDDLTYDHIVIDEAQDMTPLQFKVLSAYSRNNSMTVLGDLQQGIYAHHGVKDWAQLAEAVGKDGSHIRDLRRSYRSTEEIINFANAMLARIGIDEDNQIVPIARSGNEPAIHSVQSSDDLKKQIHQLVRKERREGWQSIAIVAKTAATCDGLAEALTEVGLEEFQQIQDASDSYSGGTVIIPTYLTKGLEFDVVIVADADAETYPADELHTGLLFVTITRASHALHICHEGEITPLLDPACTDVSLSQLAISDLEPHLVTVETFTKKNGDLKPGWCVERLAGSDKLRLLTDGTIDEVLLAVILNPYLENQHLNQEAAVEMISDDAQDKIRQQVQGLDLLGKGELQQGLAFTQLAYGLLRNQLRAVGLQLVPEVENDLAEQVIVMVALLRSLQLQDIVLGTGRWTTTRRVQQTIYEQWQDEVQATIELLVDYGIVEQSGERIRVNQDWIPGLLSIALGDPPDEWDDDLLAQIARPTESLGWFSLVREVSHE